MDWLQYLIVPFIISVLATPVLKIIGCKLNIYAEMNERTIHKKPMARVGGVAIYIAFIISMAMYMKVDTALNGILIGGTIMFIGGLIDDMDNLKPIYKMCIRDSLYIDQSGIDYPILQRQNDDAYYLSQMCIRDSTEPASAL